MPRLESASVTTNSSPSLRPTATTLARPIAVPKGTRLVVTAHFDNSVNNKFNPDPNRTVYYGDMTWEEMMFPFFSVIVDKNVNPRRVIQIVRGRRSEGA